MPELVNTFSWSFSAAEDFDECRRKRYWAKYAMWNGWKENATPLQQTAYRLTKMDNVFSLLGDAVEASVMWVLRQKQAGADVPADDAYERVTKPFLNKAWQESRKRLWALDPRKYCCLREHYYGEMNAEAQAKWVAFVTAQARRCLANFIGQTLPKLASIRQDQELSITKIGAGDPESFAFEGIKVYAIPDYAYWMGDLLHIHDWKAGKPRERHGDQLALYGLWAHVKHGVKPDNIHVYIEYLAEGSVESRQLSEATFEVVKQRIAESVADMAEYLVDGDIKRNMPLPQEEWDLAMSRDTCRMCNFYELCKPELEA